VPDAVWQTTAASLSRLFPDPVCPLDELMAGTVGRGYTNGGTYGQSIARVNVRRGIGDL